MSRPSRHGMTAENSRVYRFRAPNELLDAWEQFARDHSEEAPDLLRRAMEQVMRRTPAPRPKPALGDLPTLTTSGEVDRSAKKAVKLLLTQDEHAALSAIAEERECSVQFWIVSLVRAALTRGVTVGGAELQALGESNYQLMAIGRNLNQIAHHINADPSRNLHRITSRMIETLSRKIDEHRKQVHGLVEACTHRWKLKPAEPNGN